MLLELGRATVPLLAVPPVTRRVDRVALAARAASSKLGRDTLVLGVENLLGLTDAFVITSGANPRQVHTISDEVERQLKLAGAGGPGPSRAWTTCAGSSWTTATSWYTCSWRRPVSSMTSSIYGAMPPVGPGTTKQKSSSPRRYPRTEALSRGLTRMGVRAAGCVLVLIAGPGKTSTIVCDNR